jgi:peroxiredoxin
LEVSYSQEIRVPVGDPKVGMIKIEKLLGVKVAEVAPDFQATTLDGKAIKLSDLRGKVVLLDFWATWCGPCIAELPNVKQAYEKYGKGGAFEIVGISLDQDPEQVRRFVKSQQMPWPQIVLGPGNPVAKQYNVTAIPATFLIDRDGKVIAKDLRGKDLDQELAKHIKPPAEAATR